MKLTTDEDQIKMLDIRQKATFEEVYGCLVINYKDYRIGVTIFPNYPMSEDEEMPISREDFTDQEYQEYLEPLKEFLREYAFVNFTGGK